MMKMKFPLRIVFLVVVSSIFTSACHPALKEPEIITHSEVVESTIIINHEKPVFSIDTPSFESLGCPPSASPGGFNECSDNSTLRTIGCFGVFTPDSLLGGLNPTYPLIECALDDNNYLYTSGCLANFNIGLVAYIDGDYKLIDSESKLRNTYAPIESDEEALSYALAGTGLLAYYNLNISDEYEYYVDKLEDTFVTKDGEDFLVHLYDYRLCGCGQHETYSVDVRVTHTGYIEQIRKELVYRDTSQMCID